MTIRTVTSATRVRTGGKAPAAVPPPPRPALRTVPPQVVKYRDRVARFKETTKRELDLVDRLLTDLNMLLVWEAIGNVEIDPTLPIHFLDAVRNARQEWQLMSKMPKKEIETELRKIADGAQRLAKMVRGSAAEIYQGRGALELGPLICAAQGHDYYHGLDLERADDAGKSEFSDTFSSDHRCRIFPWYKAAASGKYQNAKLPFLGDHLDPPACPRPSFNPLTTEAYSHLCAVEDLLDALANWLRTQPPLRRQNLRPTKVGGKTAERTFMARHLSRFFEQRLGERLHTLVATTVRVALAIPEDDNFGADHVRKAVD